MLTNGFVLHPDKYLLPGYKISPFRTEDVILNRSLPHSAEADSYFSNRFPGRRFVYCENGRQAIRLALERLGLGKEDLVTIFTTTGNRYISGCVTQEIELVCQWSRAMQANTKALFVNHEFGFPYEELRALKRFGLPIIEDAAHSFASNNQEGTVSQIGDFSVYSLPKFFPIQIGGLLVFEQKYRITETITTETRQYIQKVVSYHLSRFDLICRKRRENHEYLSSRLAALGLTPRFTLVEGIIPGVFMFKSNGRIDLPALKTFLSSQGIECSVFYGEDAFYLPVNERLERGDLDYFCAALGLFARQSLDEGRESKSAANLCQIP
jgi:hypothetical protein